MSAPASRPVVNLAGEVLGLHTLKARYCRYLDAKDWAAWRPLFNDDVRVSIDAPPGTAREATVFDRADTFVAYVAESLAPCVTIHCAYLPELTVESERDAAGVWAMFDWIDNRATGRGTQGFGHYHERYVKGSDGNWRIDELRLTRTRFDAVGPPKGRR